MVGENELRAGRLVFIGGIAANDLDVLHHEPWLSLSPRTLDRYRVSGNGPAFRRFGSRVRHLAEYPETWVSARRLSISDEGAAGREARP